MAHTHTNPYDGNFFLEQEDSSLRSARQIVPIVLDLIGVKSVVDVGCGKGTWLAAFRELGCEEVLGIDGSYVTELGHLLGHDEFMPSDLRQLEAIPGRYDFGVCLEVLEHLPESSGRRIIQALAQCTDTVLFSAAIPGQTGTHHINEQWHEHWHAQFAKHNFKVIDCIRPKVFGNREIASWYRQNIFLYANHSAIERNDKLKALVHLPADSLVPIARDRLESLTHPSGLVKELGRHLARFVSGQPIR